jgi:hypothetical protein
MPRGDSPSPAPASQPTTAPHRGLALLDSIFASATPSPPITNYPRGMRQPQIQLNGMTPSASAPSVLSQAILPITTESPPILSPQPTSTSLPQILNQDVISSLLGLTPTPSPDSRSSSAAPSSSSSRNNRYEGDNEGSDGGFSESSTVLDADAETNVELQAAGASAGIPLLAVPAGEEQEWVTNGQILGDETPRPPLRPELHGSKSSTPPLSASSQSRKRDQDRPLSSYSLSPNLPAVSSPSAAIESRSATSSEPPRSQIPFQANSTIWPYPRAPLDDRSSEVDEDIVELDFADTSALSDPDIFRSRRVQQREKGKVKKNGKKGKKEGTEDSEREKLKTEMSLDTPSQSQSGSSVPPSPAPSTQSTGYINGKTRPSPNSPCNAVNGMKGGIRGDIARQTIVDSVSSQEKLKSVPALGRNEFVREVLSLIHVGYFFHCHFILT